LFAFIPILLSQSRGPLLSVLSTILILLFVQRRWKMVACFLGVVLLTAFLMLYGDVGYRDVTDLKNVYIRLGLWMNVVDGICENPLLGVGWLKDTVFEYPSGHLWYHAHNFYLQSIYLQGALGFLPLLVLMLRGIWVAIKNSSKNFEYMAFLGVIMCFLLNGMTSSRWIYTNPDMAWLGFWLPLSILSYSEMKTVRSVIEYKNV
jgi:O-antigen ligase